MIWTFLTKKIDFGIKSPAIDKYYQFIRKIVSLKKVWVLKENDGWVVISNNDGHKLLLLWSNMEYAITYSRKNYLNAKPVPIDICDFIMKWFPDMVKDKVKVLLFPALDTNAVLVSVKKMKDDIEDEQDYC